MRKIAAMLVALGLTIGLIGAGVSATFTDGVTATQNIEVGTFDCSITAATPGAVIASGAKSVTYNAPDIMSGAAGDSPFFFDVTAGGGIPVLATISHSALSAPFGSLNDPIAPVAMDVGETKTYNVGLSWSDLNGYEGANLSITYTVDCSEVNALTTFGPAEVTGSGPWGFYVGSGEWGGVALTSSTTGKAIGDVDFSFDRVVGESWGGGAPRFSLPIALDGVNHSAYAFIDATSCGGDVPTVSTTLASCQVSFAPDGTGYVANWDAFVTAHPGATITPGRLPFVVMDVPGTYTISNIVVTP